MALDNIIQVKIANNSVGIGIQKLPGKLWPSIHTHTINSISHHSLLYISFYTGMLGRLLTGFCLLRCKSIEMQKTLEAGQM